MEVYKSVTDGWMDKMKLMSRQLFRSWVAKNDNLTVPWVCLQFLIVVFPDHTHYFWVRSHSVGKALDLGSRVASSIVTASE